MKCEYCNTIKETTILRANPYIEDVKNKTVMQYLCDECYQFLKVSI